MNTVITNCSNNYGPKQHDEKLIPTIIRNALKGNPIPIYGDGNNIRDWLYVLDHCSGKNERTNLQIVDAITTILDEKVPSAKSYKELITFVEDRAGHDRRYAIDATKLENELGWKAEKVNCEAREATLGVRLLTRELLRLWSGIWKNME